MKQILIVAMTPHTLDFSSPEFDVFPGLTAEKVEMGLKSERENLKKLGYHSEMCLFDYGKLELATLLEQLKNNTFDGILIGAGLRVCNSNFILFEKTINAIHENAPNAKIIFNTNPKDTAESVQRWL